MVVMMMLLLLLPPRPLTDACVALHECAEANTHGTRGSERYTLGVEGAEEVDEAEAEEGKEDEDDDGDGDGDSDDVVFGIMALSSRCLYVSGRNVTDTETTGIKAPTFKSDDDDSDDADDDDDPPSPLVDFNCLAVVAVVTAGREFDSGGMRILFLASMSADIASMHKESVRCESGTEKEPKVRRARSQSMWTGDGGAGCDEVEDEKKEEEDEKEEDEKEEDVGKDEKSEEVMLD